jgi:hypothetical protein
VIPGAPSAKGLPKNQAPPSVQQPSKNALRPGLRRFHAALDRVQPTPKKERRQTHAHVIVSTSIGDGATDNHSQTDNATGDN